MTQTLAPLILYNIVTNNTNILKELRLTLAILLRSALAYEYRVTRNVILNVYSKETLILTGKVLRRS